MVPWERPMASFREKLMVALTLAALAVVPAAADVKEVRLAVKGAT